MYLNHFGLCLILLLQPPFAEGRERIEATIPLGRQEKSYSSYGDKAVSRGRLVYHLLQWFLPAVCKP